MIELKPCPFCGGKAKFVDFGFGGKHEDWNVKCEDCEITFWVPGDEPGCVTSKEEAARFWNRRVDSRNDIGLSLYDGLPEEGEILFTENETDPYWRMYVRKKGESLYHFLNEVVSDIGYLPGLWKPVTDEMKKLREEILKDVEALHTEMSQFDRYTDIRINEEYQKATFRRINERGEIEYNILYEFKLLERVRRISKNGDACSFEWYPW